MASKDVAEALVAEFVKTKPAATLDFKRNDYTSGGARDLLGGRDMIFTIGQVTDKSLDDAKARWKALQPQENVVGGKALAIAVYAHVGAWLQA